MKKRKVLTVLAAAGILLAGVTISAEAIRIFRDEASKVNEKAKEFVFTPDKTGYYRIAVVSNSRELSDPSLTLWDNSEEGALVMELDDAADGNYNYHGIRKLEEGHSYTLALTEYSPTEETPDYELLLSWSGYNELSDIVEGAWYEAECAGAYDEGIMTGKNETTYDPNALIIRAEIVSVLFRMSGEELPEFEAIFLDVPEGFWFSDYVTWAAKRGVVSGYDNGCFGYGDPLRREQLAVMLYNYDKSIGFRASGDYRTDVLQGFLDQGYISSYAREAVCWAVANGIISGKDNGTRIDPSGVATRAETAAMINRYLKGCQFEPL